MNGRTRQAPCGEESANLSPGIRLYRPGGPAAPFLRLAEGFRRLHKDADPCIRAKTGEPAGKAPDGVLRPRQLQREEQRETRLLDRFTDIEFHRNKDMTGGVCTLRRHLREARRLGTMRGHDFTPDDRRICVLCIHVGDLKHITRTLAIFLRSILNNKCRT